MNDDEVTDAEVVEDGDTPTDLVPVEQTALVRTAGTMTDIAAVFTDHVELVTRIVAKDDWQTIQGKQFLKKSGLRKLATAYGVSAQIIDRSTVCDDLGRVVRSEFVVRAVAPNGRTMDGFGSCDLTDKCKPNCKDGHDPRSHFSHPNHDIPATAETRAKNRAFSDLFAMGQVTAEEVGDPPQWEVLGWPSETGFRNLMDPLAAGLKAAPESTRALWKSWRSGEGIGWPVEAHHARNVRTWMQNNLGAVGSDDEYHEDRPAGEVEGPASTPGTGGESSTSAAPPGSASAGESPGPGAASPHAANGMGGGGGADPHPARGESPPSPPSPDTSGTASKAQLQRLAIMCNEMAATTMNTADLSNDEFRHAVVDAATDGAKQKATSLTKRECAAVILVAKAIEQGAVRLVLIGEKDGRLAELADA